MRFASALILFVLALAPAALAQDYGPIPGETTVIPGEAPIDKPIKGMSERQVKDLLAGTDMGQAKVAELSGYPGPVQIMSYASELNLTDEQARKILIARKRVQNNARKIGAEIVAKERELDGSFTNGTISSEELIRLTTEIGMLQGRLRASHLYSYMEIKAALTPDQLAQYKEIRGFSPSGTAP